MMSQIYTIFSFLLFMGCTFLHLFTLMGNSRIYRGVTKGLLMPLLLLFYSTTLEHTSILVVLALTFSFIGDVGLFVAENNPSVIQKGSILSFATAHIFYTLYIVIAQANPSFILISSIGALLLLITFYAKVIHPCNTLIKTFLFFYAIIITIMGTSAFISLLYHQTIGSYLLFTGALLFIFSDFLISKQILMENKKDELAIMISYILAQFLLIVGIVLLKS